MERMREQGNKKGPLLRKQFRGHSNSTFVRWGGRGSAKNEQFIFNSKFILFKRRTRGRGVKKLTNLSEHTF